MSLETPAQIRSLQNKLYAKAKAEPTYRFYLLYDKVYRDDILNHAYRLARSNAGAPGVDGVRFEDIEVLGLEEWLVGLREELRSETYKPMPVRRVMIPKPGGGERPLGIPTIRDRVVQTAAKLVLEPIFEADLSDSAYGYRAERSAQDAVKEVHQALRDGYTDVVDADLSKYLDRSSHYPLADCLMSNSVLDREGSWIRRPCCRPRRTWTALSSPRLTRCITVCRETPRTRMASNMGTQPFGALLTKSARSSSFMRMRHGAPGVIWSPTTKPSLIHRWRVDGAISRTLAASYTDISSPLLLSSVVGSQRGMPQ